MLGTRPVIEHVWRRVSKVFGDNVAVATDDTRIADCVTGFGGRVVMTSIDHHSGTVVLKLIRRSEKDLM